MIIARERNNRIFRDSERSAEAALVYIKNEIKTWAEADAKDLQQLMPLKYFS